MTVEAFAPAKINLSLHVTGRRADGYHLLDSLVAFADIGDRIRLTPAAEWSLAVEGPMAPGVPTGEDNLCLKAARMMGGPPAAITLIKELPAAAGIGGGSADAAAVLRGLNALDERPLPAEPVALGADIPVCLRARAARMRGIGEQVEDVPSLPPLYACLVNPGVTVPTPDIFATLTQRENAPMPDIQECTEIEEFAVWLARQRNDLEGPARAIAPSIGVVLGLLAATSGCQLARMSGSGATCFGLYPSLPEAREAAAEIRAQRPNWWVAATPLG
ncbi:4-diphosphocytidyl-2-C-methyl-D-erythritol kinase [Palleronia aestuarii]|uniref:4-diphosphocytidyl-2-C-methyl-D-erythritol kinase n=1 Tax=Palleronia aestuarii TaxID=568105 RepID=A0A2W7Q4K5_9RHOB|nr:4-(cytidine 5'-diphospho)-2-C-methyl-D-erythritol kinase [Palleronia aestuarii]PZX16619.1 4-diphosphocytidyl-2-C-methyl-D-erythritol kinase [Palleronia aestuarii]